MKSVEEEGAWKKNMAQKGFAAAILVGALMWGGVATTAQAASVTFDFNGVTPTCSQPAYGVACTSTQKTNDITNITNNMNSVLGAAGMGTVTLNTGTRSIQSLPDESIPKWDQTGSFKTSNQAYLGNSNGATNYKAAGTSAYKSDTYLINDWQSTSASQADRIVMTFTQSLSSVAFDWEIFPQTATPSDIQVFADVWNGSTYQQVQIFGEVLLGTSSSIGTTCGVIVACPAPSSTTYGTSLSNGAWVKTGDLGHFNLFLFDSTNALWLADLAAAGVTNGSVRRLEFVDWTTAPIGIDNLQIGSPVPEPASLLLFGSGLAGLLVWRRKKAA